EEIAPILTGIQASLEEGCGAAMLRGFRVAADPRETFLAIGEKIGTPISQSAAGELVFGVRDAGHGDDDPRARGPNTRKKLSYHSDRCDVIGFMCLNQARCGGENYLVSSAAIYNEILASRPDLLEVLMQPFYYLRHTVDTGNDKTYCRQPVFSFSGGKFACNLLRVLIERAHATAELPDLTALQKEALDYIAQLADSPAMHVSFMQQPGDLLFLNNWVTLHRRSEFEDHAEEEKKRHILRIWLSVPNSRPLDPLFLDNYGAVGAGELRGGMRAVISQR
ncbi:MAG: hypothetical protein ACI9MB_001647, partial [Verrucomicrobiales bacterium]